MSAAGWLDDARCRDIDPSVFFPAPTGPSSYDAARTICASCPVKKECLEYALRLNVSDGFFGGMSPGERGKVRSRRRLQERSCGRCGAAFFGPYTVAYCSDICRSAVRSERMQRPRVGVWV